MVRNLQAEKHKCEFFYHAESATAQGPIITQCVGSWQQVIQDWKKISTYPEQSLAAYWIQYFSYERAHALRWRSPSLCKHPCSLHAIHEQRVNKAYSLPIKKKLRARSGHSFILKTPCHLWITSHTSWFLPIKPSRFIGEFKCMLSAPVEALHICVYKSQHYKTCQSVNDLTRPQQNNFMASLKFWHWSNQDFSIAVIGSATIRSYFDDYTCRPACYNHSLPSRRIVSVPYNVGKRNDLTSCTLTSSDLPYLCIWTCEKAARQIVLFAYVIWHWSYSPYHAYLYIYSFVM
jgi:hypothetical protein